MDELVEAAGKSTDDTVGTVGRFIAKTGSELRIHLNRIVNKPIGMSYNGKMYRNIKDEFTDPTYIVRSATSDADNRFTTGLYLSETKSGNLFEVIHYNNGTQGRQLYEFSSIEVNNLLDLTDSRTIEILGTTLNDMKLINVDKAYEFTYEVGIWAKANGYSGIKFYGARGGSSDYANFVIFEENIIKSMIKNYVKPVNW